MKLFVKIVAGDFDFASRDKRELIVVNSFKDVEIVVISKGKSNSEEFFDGYSVHKRTTRPFGDKKWLVFINRFFSVFTWAAYVRKLKPYCISCHDLIALFIGWLSTLFMRKDKKPFLVYDSHEFELGRNVVRKRSKIKLFAIAKLEKFLINKCAFSIMVNDSIADEVQRIYNLKNRPVVVRNIANYWHIDKKVCHEKKTEICEKLGVPQDTFLLIYHGFITYNRGVETVINVLSKNNNAAAIILGYGEKNYIDVLKSMASELKVLDRILFHDAVPIDMLWQYVGAADASMIVSPNVCMSYYYGLPNKLFESIQSLTPIISSDFPEMRRIIEGYDIGLLIDPEDHDDIIRSIEEMRTNKEMYNRFKSNLNLAKEELCWENESKVLKEAYSKVLG